MQEAPPLGDIADGASAGGDSADSASDYGSSSDESYSEDDGDADVPTMTGKQFEDMKRMIEGNFPWNMQQTKVFEQEVSWKDIFATKDPEAKKLRDAKQEVTQIRQDVINKLFDVYDKLTDKAIVEES